MVRKSATPKTVPTKEKTLGDIVNDLLSIKDQKAALAQQEKVLNERKALLEADLLVLMQQQGASEITVNSKRVSFKLKPRPKIVDGALLWKYLKKLDRYDLYYARLKTAEYEELYHLNKDKPLPGTEVVSEPEISIRSVSVAV